MESLRLWLGLFVVVCSVASPTGAQIDPFGGPGGGAMGGGAPPGDPEPEYVRPREALEPLPEPLSKEEEAARERAKEKGALVSENPQPGRISEVRIVGARKVEADAVLVQVQSRIDRAPDRSTIQADVRRIWAMDIFDDVIVEASPGKNNSLVLVYRLIEKPAIDEVLYEGNRDVSKDDIAEVVDLKAFQVLDVARIKANVAKIQKLYVDKGYYLAQVAYEVRPSLGTAEKSGTTGLLDLFGDRDRAAGPTTTATTTSSSPARPDIQEAGQFVDVVFVITEAAKVKVERVVLVGNEKISSDEILPVLRTRENHPLGILTEWGTYKVEGSEIDVLAVEAVYQDRGFINVAVGKPRVALSQDKTRITLTIPITEGTQYRLRSLDVGGDLVVESIEAPWAADGPPLFARTDLLARTKIRAGDLFSRTQVAMDVQALADRYRDAGYAFVNIEPQFVPHEEDNTLSLMLNIQSGPRVTIERIEITGNTKTQDSVIRRELRVYEGEFYSASMLRLSEQRANALGFFEKVAVTTKQGSKPDRMVLVFDVKEKSTGTFQVGAGFSNAESVIFNGQIAYNNFLGLGTTVSGSAQFSNFRRIFDFRYIDPYVAMLGQQPLTLSLSAFNTSRFFLDFTRNSTGGDVTLGYPVGKWFADAANLTPWTKQARSDASPTALPYVPDFENLQVFLSGNLERVEIAEDNFNVRIKGLQLNLPRWTTSTRLSTVWDMRNNRLFPSAGWFLQGSVELASPFLGAALLPAAEAATKDFIKGTGIRDLPFCTGVGCLKRDGVPNTFTRYTATARGYLNGGFLLPELSGVVLKANVDLGFIDTANQLIFENYYMGGFNTIRGYFLRSISPIERVGSATDPSGSLTEFRTGGTKQFMTNVELEFPIFEPVGIRGVLFFDAGNTYGQDENFFYIGNGPTPSLALARCNGGPCWDPRTQLPLGLYSSVGAGVRWFSPMGPLRFEWGVPLTPRPVGTFGFAQGDQPFQFEFNVGNSF